MATVSGIDNVSNVDAPPLPPEEIVQALAAFTQLEQPVDVRALANGAFLIDENVSVANYKISLNSAIF
jgi:hypothetical protein